MTAIPVLTTKRLTLRAPTEADFPAWAAFYAGERSTMVGGPVSAKQAWRGLAAELGHWALKGFGRWAVEQKASGAFCGMVGLWCPQGWPEPEIGWATTAAAEGRSIALEAVLAARSHAYGALGWTTAISMINPANSRSVALATRMGAARGGDFIHERFGPMGIWRHPAPEILQ